MTGTIRVDGGPLPLLGEPAHRTLLDLLRARGKVGTKEGCAEGDCGACTVVLVDEDGRDLSGQPVRTARAINACLVPAHQLDGASIWTVEGLGSPTDVQTWHEVHRRMIEDGGSQCGYCTPGFVMALVEASCRTDAPTPGRIADAIAGNLCRCTGYRPIQSAAESCFGTEPPPAIAAALDGPARAQEPLVEGSPVEAPTSLADLLRRRAARPEVRVVAGATDLGLDITQKHERPEQLLSVDRVAELKVLRVEAGVARIGAGVRLADLEAWSETPLPAVHRMLRYFGARAIKQRGTLGGNLVNASPIGDMAPVLLAHGATLVVASVRGERQVPIERFFTGYRRTDLAADEVVVEARLPLPAPTDRVTAFKVSRRRELDISAVSFAGWVRLDADAVVRGVRLAFGGVAATPVRAYEAEAASLGRPFTPEGLAPALAALQQEFQPLSDLRASEAYRRTLMRNLLLGFVLESRDGTVHSLPPRHTGTVVLSSAEGL